MRECDSPVLSYRKTPLCPLCVNSLLPIPETKPLSREWSDSAGTMKEEVVEGRELLGTAGG